MPPRNNPTPARSNPAPKASAPAPKASAPVGASKAAVQAFAASNPNSRTAQAINTPKAAPKISTANTVSQALRIAGANGNVSKGELQKITNQFNVGSDQAVRRLDKINTGLKENGKDLKIGLGSGAVNSLINAGNTYTSGIFTESKFGSGNIGKTVQNYINASRPTGGYQNPQSGSSSYRPVNGAMSRAAAQSAAGLIPLQRGNGYQINSKGGYTPKVSNAAFGMPSTKPVSSQGPYDNIPIMPTDQDSSGPWADDPNLDMLPEMLPEEKQEEEKDPGAGMLSGGGAGAAGANKLGRAKSRLRQLGIYGRGTGLLGRGLQYGNALNA